MEMCDWIFGGGVVVVLVLLVLLPSLGGKLPAKDGSNAQLEFCIRKRNHFVKLSTIWYIVYYSVTLGSILATVIVIYLCNISQLDEGRVFIYSVISLFATIANFVLNPREVAATCRQCFNKLDRAISSYSHENNELMETAYECEDMVTNVLK